MQMPKDETWEKLNVFDLVSRRTRVSYRDIRQSMDELKHVLAALSEEGMATDEDVRLLEALQKHSDLQHYTLPTDPDRRQACVDVSNYIDAVTQAADNERAS